MPFRRRLPSGRWPVVDLKDAYFRCQNTVLPVPPVQLTGSVLRVPGPPLRPLPCPSRPHRGAGPSVQSPSDAWGTGLCFRDDVLIASDDQREAQAAVQLPLLFITQVGFVLNLETSDLPLPRIWWG